MKKIIILAALLYCHIGLQAQERKLTLSLNKQPLTQLLEQIQRQCRYHFVYSDEVLSDSMRVSLNVVNLPVNQVLDMVLPTQRLFYQVISDRLIAIGKQGTSENGKAVGKILRGEVVDLQGNGIPFSSINLSEKGLVQEGTICSEDGSYQLSFAFQVGHAYRLKAASMGYQPKEFDFTYSDTTNTIRMVLTEDRTMLKTVNITAERPLVERRTDRYIVNVEGSALSTGLNGLEVLQKSPGLWVSNNGAITIRGNQSVMVMINDVVQRMSSDDLASYLRTLRSEDISKIEIISSPPSEFEAAGSGGIVHIILKKSRKDGLVGSVSGLYRQLENRPAYNGGLSLNYKVKDLYLSGSFSVGNEESDYIATNRIHYPMQEYYSSHTDRYNNNGRQMFRVAAGYDLNKNQSIGLQSMQTRSTMNQYFNTYIDFIGAQPLTGIARSEWFRKPLLNSTTLNYVLKTDTLGSTFKVIADYVYSQRSETNNFSSVYSYAPKNSTYRNNTPNTTDLYSLQSDYTQVLKKQLTFKAGLKAVATKRDNEVVNENLIDDNWQLNPGLSNHFIYREDLYMAYSSLEKTWGKLSVKGGIRLEHTRMNGNSVTGNEQFTRNYLGLFPSVFIAQKLNEVTGSAIYLNYAKRLQRPSFSDLNPYRLQFDNYLTQLGNPNLTPEYTHKVEFGTLFPKGLSADIYYSITTDKIAQLANPVAGNIIEYQTRNFNSSQEYGFSIFAPVKLAKWWSTNNSIAGYHLKYTLGSYRINQATFYARSQHNISFNKWFDLDLAFDYRSPQVSANTHLANQFVADMGLTKRIFDKSLQFRLYFSDIFNTAREKDYTKYGDTRIDFYQKRPTRTLSLSINYTFSSGKKFSNKKIEQSNEDEKRRIGN